MSTLDSHSADETFALGEALGRVLEPGDVVSLLGPLGAGKTAFTQGVARGLGVPAEAHVRSPTFTIVNEHRGRVPLYHVDLYRVADASELDEIGFYEYLSGEGVCVVEWFDRVPEARPGERLEISFEIVAEEERRLEVRAFGATAEGRLRDWMAAR